MPTVFKILFLLIFVAGFNVGYGQSQNTLGTYYMKSKFVGCYLILELKPDSTYIYDWNADWSGKLDKGKWTFYNDILKLHSNDSLNNKSIEYKVLTKIDKNQIKEAKSNGYWTYLIKSKINYGADNSIDKINPYFNNGQYLIEVKRE